MLPFRRWPPYMRQSMACLVLAGFIVALIGCACYMLPEFARYAFEGGSFHVFPRP